MEKEKTGDMLHCHWSIAPMTPELLALTVKAGPPSDKRAAPSFGCWWIPHVHCLVNVLMDLALMLPKDSHCYSTLLLWARAQTGPRDRPSEVMSRPLPLASQLPSLTGFLLSKAMAGG